MLILTFLACVGSNMETVPAPTDLLAELRSHPMKITRHAQCRMDCRHITLEEAKQLLVDGTWVPERTRLDGECPSHAVEGHSSDGQHLRVVYAACDNETRLITAIDLDTEHPCDCN